MSGIVTKLDLLRDLDPLSEHIVASRRGKSGEIGKNRQDLAELVQRLMGSSVKPQVLLVTPQPLHGGVITGQEFHGRDFLPPGWRKSEILVNQTPAPNTALIWRSILPGVASNLLEVEYVRGVGPAPTSVAFVLRNRIQVVIQAAGDTPANVRVALAAAVDGSQYAVEAIDAPGSTGLGVIVAPVIPAPPAHVPVYALAGGTGISLLTASLHTQLGVPNADLLFISRVPGPKGNAVSIEYLDTGSVVPVVHTSGQKIAVEIDATVTLASAVLAALQANENVKMLIDAELGMGSTGAGAVIAMAATHLDDMSGYWHTDNIPLFGGVPGSIVSVTNDTIVADFPAAAPFAAGDTVFIELKVCDTRHTIPVCVV